MCSDPVTFGGGSAMLKCGRLEAASARLRRTRKGTSAVRRARQPDTRRAAVCAANVAANLLTPPTVLVEVAVHAPSLRVHTRVAQLAAPGRALAGWPAVGAATALRAPRAGG